MRELWTVRDQIARSRDIAPGRILPDSAIVAAAMADPKTSRNSPRCRDLRRAQAASQRRVWLDALAAPRPTRIRPHRRTAERAAARGAVESAQTEAAARRRGLAGAGRGRRGVNVPTENLVSPDLVRRLCWDWTGPPTGGAVETGLPRSGGARSAAAVTAGSGELARAPGHGSGTSSDVARRPRSVDLLGDPDRRGHRAATQPVTWRATLRSVSPTCVEHPERDAVQELLRHTEVAARDVDPAARSVADTSEPTAAHPLSSSVTTSFARARQRAQRLRHRHHPARSTTVTLMPACAGVRSTASAIGASAPTVVSTSSPRPRRQGRTSMPPTRQGRNVRRITFGTGWRSDRRRRPALTEFLAQPAPSRGRRPASPARCSAPRGPTCRCGWRRRNW